MGQSDECDYAAGFTTVCVDLAVDEILGTRMTLRLFSVCVWMMKRESASAARVRTRVREQPDWAPAPPQEIASVFIRRALA